MRAQYLVRFDDICPTMNWKIWTRIESVLLEFRIRPILAVIPDNRDPKLMVSEPHPEFWQEVRKWQARGWTIGLHGYQHVYSSREGGILRFPTRSEFAGISPHVQNEKLARAIEIFCSERVIPEIWVAPAHSFDQSTITLLNSFGLRVISDGFAISPHLDSQGMFWVPQQLWKFRRRPFGTWTVCYHHNLWCEKDLHGFGRFIQRYHSSITNLDEIKNKYESRARQFWDGIYSALHVAALSVKQRIRFAQ